MDWSSQQTKALSEVSQWLRTRDHQVFYLAGYAGTGKTTLAQYMAAEVNGLVLFAAFTGKAASVLRRKGCPEARTLHSILYDVSDADKTRLRELETKLRQLVEAKPEGPEEAMRREDQMAALEDLIREERKHATGPRFRLNPESTLKEADLLVLDECSMINEPIGRDILSFGKPVLVLGDPAQLPPVKGAGYFTNDLPDILLTEIHRQAQDNAIVRAATAVREHRRIPYGDWDDIRHLPHDSVDTKAMYVSQVKEGAQILVGYNKSRRTINRIVRKALGYTAPYPEEGETLVVLRNDSQMGILNGVVCRAASDARDDEAGGEDVMIRLDYEGTIIPESPMDKTPFDMYTNPSLAEQWHPGMNRYAIAADWGYALTVHKSQGSEWDQVLLVDDGFGRGDLRWRWLYTAITRASSRLTIISRGRGRG